jgi:iron complex transport system permease protein
MTLRATLPRLLLLALLAIAAIVLSVRFGAVSLSAGEVIAALRGQGDPTHVVIVQGLRLPRAVQAALVGAALALSGATFQALLRNPLAEPYILGVSGGAAVGAVGAVVLGWAVRAMWAVPLAAFVGALLSIALVLRIAASVGRALDTRILLLAGVVVGAFFNACILLLLTFADVESFRSAVFWMMGSFAGASWNGAGLFAFYLVPGVLVLLALARPLNLLAIGEDTASYLGVSVERTKYLAYGTASLLTAAAVAVSGVIGFVGLIVPHLVRPLTDRRPSSLIVPSALAGALLVLVADMVCRVLPLVTELRLGIALSLIGAPFFLHLLLRMRRGLA